MSPPVRPSPGTPAGELPPPEPASRPRRAGSARQPTAKRPTLRDVAARAGVDPSAVSRVLNNEEIRLSEATRERIRQAAEELGYTPNFLARSLRQSRTWTLGFVLPDIGNPMYVPIVRGAQRRAEERGYGIVVGSQLDGDTYGTFARLLEAGRIDGLLVASGTLHDDYIRTIASSRHGPVVLVNRRIDGPMSSVIVDDTAGSRLAMGHLLERGHRHIGALIGPPDIDTSRRRRQGVEDAAREWGITPVIVTGYGWSADEGYRCAMRVLDTAPQVTAIFASTLLMGIGALRLAHDQGIQVPTYLSVIALHDSELAEYLIPPLTTVAMPTEQLGATAVDVILDHMQGSKPVSITVPGSGVIRERRSVSSPRGASHGAEPVS
jgi:LacI family transcriptional regulator